MLNFKLKFMFVKCIIIMQNMDENPIIFWEGSSMDISDDELPADEPSIESTRNITDANLPLDQDVVQSDTQISGSECTKVCNFNHFR